ncbi:hypothetical protein SCHPADRAFT_867237 [Schizopora paradoxa]|uniref:protein-tyrosine-phosphatase n=1 Tax=Schizopora paradoxa TaxID=27342 RepID=A0A0H2S2L9_9AGAM|nr:hypothetical protein SCHPADRAFT_867237 [Schizopora paradoxa]
MSSTSSAMSSRDEDVEAQVPDMTRILDGLFIGNLSSATSLHEHPELGITHILSVCPQNRGGPLQINTAASPPNALYTATSPRHCSIIIDDSETQDIILHLPAAVAFIRDALQESSFPTEPSASGSPIGERGVDKGQHEACLADTQNQRRNHKVLVHCVMGISRSATVVCAYLMATRRFSPAQALAFVRRRRPQVHPNYGFYRQLAVFAECDYFAAYPASVRTHPAYNAWVRRKKRDVSRYLSRVGNVVEIDLGGGNVLSMTDDFPTDVTEAACLLGEIEATHFLTVTPSTLPPLPPPPARSAGFRQSSRSNPYSPSSFLAPALGPHSANSGSSSISSPTSSRSSSFSNGMNQRNLFSGPSTPATSVTSFDQSNQGKYTVDEGASSEEELDEPNFLSLTGVKHYHIGLPTGGQTVPEQADMLLRLNEACSVIDCACDLEDSDCDDLPEVSNDEPSRIQRSTSPKKSNVLVHCSTESRAALVMCAYLMYGQSLSPKNAYSKLETALPLFNATKSFLDQLELFYACDCAPSRDDPLINAWIAAGCKGVPDARRARSGSTSSRALARQAALAAQQQQSPTSPSSSQQQHQQWQRPLFSGEEDCDSDSDDGEVLRRKIGTPARCGSFAAHMATRPSFGQYTPSQLSSNAASRTSSRRPSVSSAFASLQMTALGNSAQPPGSSVPRSTGPIRRGTNSDVDVDKLLRRVAGVGRPDFQLDVEAFRGTLRDLGLRTGNMNISGADS